MPRRPATDNIRSPTKGLGSNALNLANYLDTTDTNNAEKSKVYHRAQLSVDSDDENPDPEALAQFLGSKTDLTIPFALQREKLWQEKTRSVKRANAILRQNGDLLHQYDLQGALEDTDIVREDIDSYLSMHSENLVHQEEELVSVEHWLNKKSEEARRDNLEDEPEDSDSVTDSSFKDVSRLVASMGAMRSRMSAVADKLVSRMYDIVRNDESKRLLKEQQDRFNTEISIIMEALQRVEGHAKGLTTTNLELRESLKIVEEEKLSWERRYMSLQAKEESLVRQIESAIQQRTEALQIHLAKGGTGALAQLMDQVRQHQLDLFAAQESLRVKEEELSKALSDKEILEARIASFANEMIDLRQAAGPTANLISKLKEDARNAQLSERSVREELRVMKEGIKPKQKEPVLLELQIKETKAASTQTAADTRKFWAQASQTDNVHISSIDSQADAVKMRGAIESYRGMMQEKDHTIELQTGEIKSKNELIQMYIDSSSAQLDKYQAKHVALERALEERSMIIGKLKAEIDTMEKRLREVERSKLPHADPQVAPAGTAPDAAVLGRQGSVLPAAAAGSDPDVEAETQLRRLANQNQRIVQDYQHVVDQYKQEQAKAEELRYEVQRQKSITDLLMHSGNDSAERRSSAELSDFCLHFCSRALQLIREVCGVLGAKEGPFTQAEASELLEQGKQPDSAKISFEKLLQALLSLLKSKWSAIADVMATLQQTRQEATELAKEQATINFSQLVGASRLAEVHKVLASATPPRKMPKTMQERYEEQKGRWERRKEQIRQERSACITRCLDSFMKVVEVNFKLPLATSIPASPPQSARAVVYSTLLDLNHVSTSAELNFRARVSPPPQRVVHTSVYTLPIPAPAASSDSSYRLRLNSAAAERYAGQTVLSARGQGRSGVLDGAAGRNGAITSRDGNSRHSDAMEGSIPQPGHADGLGAFSGWTPGSAGNGLHSARTPAKASLWAKEHGKDRGTGQDPTRVYVPLTGLPSSAGPVQSWRSRVDARLPASARHPERSDLYQSPRNMWKLHNEGIKDSSLPSGNRENGVHVVKLLPFLL